MQPDTQSDITPQGPVRALRFDRCFQQIGVPRLQRSSGTKDPAEFAVLNDLLTTLAASDTTAVIVRMFAAGRLSVAELELARTSPGRTLLSDRAATLERGESRAPRAGRSVGTVDGAVQAETVKPKVAAAQQDVLTHILGDRPSPIELVERPLWTTGRALIAAMDVKDVSARRYLTSFEALRRKTAMLAISAELRDAVAGISELEWAALETFGHRGLSIDELKALVGKPVTAQEQYLRSRRIKLSTESLVRVNRLTRAEWEALEAVTPYGVSAAVMRALDQLTKEEQEALPKIAALFGPDATFANLVKMTDAQWRLLSKVWAASQADWNHVRRVTSALLTQLYDGDTANPVRQYVMARIPLLGERGRVPNLTPEMFWRIMEHLPEHARSFPLFLVISGLRMGEYEALEPSNLHHETCMISVPGTKTEGSYDQISIAPDLWQVAVNAIPSPYRYAWMRQIWRLACDAAGVTGVTLHDLRHCHGQWALANGALEPEVQAQLRHTSIAMTRRYTQTLAKQKSAAAAAGAVMAGRAERV